MVETEKLVLEAAIKVLQRSSRGRRVMYDVLHMLNDTDIAGLDQYGQHALLTVLASFFSGPMTTRDALQEACTK